MTRVVCTRLVCLAIFVASLFAAGGCSTTKESYIAKGNKLFAAGRYDEAALNYRAAIQKDPGFGEAYYHLGLTAAKLNQGRLAYASLSQAVQRLPRNIDAKKSYADVCLSLYLADPAHSQLLYDQIVKLSDEFISSNHNSYEGLMLKGYLASTNKKPKDAIEYFRKALRANSSDAGVVTELAHLLIQDGEIQKGEQLANNLIGHKTTYGPAYDLLYLVYLKTNRPVEAENVLRAKVANNPKNADYAIELAAHYNRTHNAGAMAGVLLRLMDDPKDFPQARLWVGDFYLGLRDYDQAISYYQQGMRDSRDGKSKAAYELRNVLALASEGKRDEALRLASEFQRENPGDNAILRVHADLLLAQGRRENAGAVVREFQTLSNQNPGDSSLHMQLGRAYRLKRDLDNARQQFLQVHDGRDVTASRYQLAEIALLQHRPQETVQRASEILRAQPKDRQARLLYVTGLIGAGNATTARAVLMQLIRDFPQDPEPQIRLGLLALADRNFAKAIEILGKFRATEPRASAALAKAYLYQKQFDHAHAILNEGLAKWPDSPVLIQQLADTEALSGRYDPALTHYQKVLSLDPDSIDVRRRLAEVWDLQGDRRRSLAIYQEVYRLTPGDAASAVDLADALARAGRVDEARDLYKNIARTHPENAPALNNAAFFLADTGGDLDEALRLAQNALAKIPGQPSFSDTIAYIYLKKGMLDSAIQSFSTLARKYPESASFRYHLGLALLQKGEKAGARKELQAALADHPSAQETLRIRELLNEIS